MVCVVVGWAVQAQDDATVREYIKRFSPIAVEEMRRTGVPASITLAQGIVESAAGTSMLAQRAHNHFGIKCHDWQGPRIYKDDENRKECFRKYNSPEESFRDHSEFLRTRSRYAFLFELDPLDYRAWAYGLKNAGYATDPRYPEKLIGIIERYNLARFDTLALKGERYSQESELTESREAGAMGRGVPVIKINGVKAVRTDGSLTIAEVAGAFGLRETQVRRWNDNLPDEIIYRAGVIYIQPKRRRSIERKSYVVEKGETVELISQKVGVKVHSLRQMNGLEKGQQPVAGSELLLRGWRR